MNLNFTNSSWFPLNKFTKTGCHHDYMMGVSGWKGKIIDAISGRKIKPYQTVFWNRELGINVSYDSYCDAVKDPSKHDILKKLELPLDIKI